MLGIGFGEFMVLAIVLIIAVGPKAMPTFMKTVGRGLREFRRATRDLRNQVGLDELLRDDPWGRRRAPQVPPPKPRQTEMTDADRARELPPEGVDVAVANQPASEAVPAPEAVRAPEAVPAPEAVSAEAVSAPEAVSAEQRSDGG